VRRLSWVVFEWLGVSVRVSDVIRCMDQVVLTRLTWIMLFSPTRIVL